jgi:hypothetical protein
MMTTHVRLSLLSLLVLAGACQRAPDEAPPPAAARLTTEPTDTPPPAADEPTLAVARQADGTLKLFAVDRWGNSMDAVYENAEFLRRAAPTLERGLTPHQVEQLHAELSRLSQGQPAP